MITRIIIIIVLLIGFAGVTRQLNSIEISLGLISAQLQHR